MSVSREDLARALDLIEAREAPLLSWGEVDGGFTFQELRSLLEDVVPDGPETLIEQMRLRGLIFEDVAYDPSRYRSRSAETVRLLARLRQLFPKANDPTGNWQQRPSLVRDFRFEVRPREVPRRDQRPSETISALEDLATSKQLDVVRRIVQEGGLDLAAFQLQAARTILSDLRRNQTRGVVVTAGTGGGKTLAFYLPALSQVANLVDDDHWVKLVAVYPRTELLRDQVAVVYRYARMLDGFLEERGVRPIRIGTLFGETPYSRRNIRWKMRSSGTYVCPYLNCPKCDDDLLWLENHREQDVECLTCARCGHEIDEKRFAITRGSMAKEPPDIVFATAEMLHRSTSDLSYGPIVGLHCGRAPHLLLLDEVHTYEGTTGAQTAQVIRRWRHLVGTPVEIVGLSATLANAQEFFASLTGLPGEDVSHVSVDRQDLIYKGAEYALALRHDPMAGQTLSSTIQTAMCLARCLDPMDGSKPSLELFGSRLFAFFDRLDVANRFFSNLNDAEARTNFGRRKQGRVALATLRNPDDEVDPQKRRLRRIAGQSWDLPQMLGHDLTRSGSVRVTRTTSQDPGVAEDAEVVVATASLEVGFDDDRVGAIIQHGAPRDVAQFLQRKGRAGRLVHMRPWTVVVLSDFGRDRRSYQAWDGLFHPNLPPKHLPVRNRYVLRMHAAHALVDWLTVKIRGSGRRFRVGASLAQPPSEEYEDKWEADVALLIELLNDLLKDAGLRADLQRFIAASLHVSESEARQLLWYPPRAVLLETVPTLLRRVESRWSTADEHSRTPKTDHYIKYGPPLPDFMSRALFTELDSPDVTVNLPDSRGDEPKSMSFETALREFAPGNASRRFAEWTQTVSHWLPVTPPTGDADTSTLEVDSVYPRLNAVGEVEGGNPEGLRSVVQPLEVLLQKVPQEYGDQARGYPVWLSEFEVRGSPTNIELPHVGVGEHIREMTFFLHADGANIDVTRCVVASRVELPGGQAPQSRFSVRFTKGDEAVAVGHRNYNDGLRVSIDLPSNILDQATESPELERELRSSWFHHLVTTDETLLESANVFQLDRLHDALVTALVSRALDASESLQEAAANIGSDLDQAMAGALHILLERTDLPEEVPDSYLSRNRAELLALTDNKGLIDRLRELEPSLWEPFGQDTEGWLIQRIRHTLGEAVLEAARVLCSDHDPEVTILDLHPNVRGSNPADVRAVWLMERTPGGAGFLEALSTRVSQDPRAFMRMVKASLAPADMERVDRDLTQLVVGLGSESSASIRDWMQRYRGAASHDEQVRALGGLRQVLADSGIQPSHATIAGIVSRILRPGTTPETDRLLQGIVEDWIAAEEQLGIEIDVRTWIYRAWQSIEQGGLRFPGRVDPQAQLDAVSSALWPRGWQLRADSFSSWTPFEDQLPTVPTLVRRMFADGPSEIDATESGAVGRIGKVLQDSGICAVVVPREEDDLLSKVVAEAACTPVDLGYLIAFPRLAEVTDEGDRLVAHLELREVVR